MGFADSTSVEIADEEYAPSYAELADRAGRLFVISMAVYALSIPVAFVLTSVHVRGTFMGVLILNSMPLSGSFIQAAFLITSVGFLAEMTRLWSDAVGVERAQRWRFIIYGVALCATLGGILLKYGNILLGNRVLFP